MSNLQMMKMLSKSKYMLTLRCNPCNIRHQTTAVDPRMYLLHTPTQIVDGIPEYPKIYDTSPEGIKKHNRQLWYDKIKAMPTVEAKLYELCARQVCSLRKYYFRSMPSCYDQIPHHQYVTRTLLVDHLPEKLTRMNVDEELSEIRDTLNEALLNYYCDPWRGHTKKLSEYLNEDLAGASLLKNFVSLCYRKMAPKNDYLMDSIIHHRPRICSFWWHGGFESARRNYFYDRNICLQYHDSPAFTIRMKKPLSPVLDLEDPFCSTADVPNYHFHPKVVGVAHKQKSLKSSAGYWPDDPLPFPLMLVYTKDRFERLLAKLEGLGKDMHRIECSTAIMASFGSLSATAVYQGFTPYHDLTYPLVTQMIITNGQDWHFFTYQLNTIAFHEDVDQKDRRNICWSSGNVRLFDTIEDGQIKGINEEVYKLLMKFLLNAPVPQKNVVLQPYLVGEDQRTPDEIENTRYFLRRIMSQVRAPDSHEFEVPTWQRIYKFHKDAPPSPFVRMV